VTLAPEWLKRSWRDHAAAVIAALAVVVATAAIALVWPVTDLIATHDVGLITGPKRAAALLTAREAVRTQLLTLGAGVFAAGALIFTARNFRLSRRTVELTQQTFRLTERGQVTDRYARAIEQLGSAGPSVRLGAIFALERISRDSAEDSPTVMGVLAAYVRERSHNPTCWRTIEMPPDLGTKASDVRQPGPDLQAALTVLGRRDRRLDTGPLDLMNADLSHGYLPSARLDGTDLTGALLSGADLTEANLAGAKLPGADLRKADLSRADLTGAQIALADLTDADLSDADLRGTGWPSILIAPTMTDANLTGAIVDPGAPLPEGWQRDAGTGKAWWAGSDKPEITESPPEGT